MFISILILQEDMLKVLVNLFYNLLLTTNHGPMLDSYNLLMEIMEQVWSMWKMLLIIVTNSNIFSRYVNIVSMQPIEIMIEIVNIVITLSLYLYCQQHMTVTEPMTVWQRLWPANDVNIIVLCQCCQAQPAAQVSCQHGGSLVFNSNISKHILTTNSWNISPFPYS